MLLLRPLSLIYIIYLLKSITNLSTIYSQMHIYFFVCSCSQNGWTFVVAGEIPLRRSRFVDPTAVRIVYVVVVVVADLTPSSIDWLALSYSLEL